MTQSELSCVPRLEHVLNLCGEGRVSPVHDRWRERAGHVFHTCFKAASLAIYAYAQESMSLAGFDARLLQVS